MWPAVGYGKTKDRAFYESRRRSICWSVSWSETRLVCECPSFSSHGRESSHKQGKVKGLDREKMSLRKFFGLSSGEVMRADAKPCSTLMRQTAGVFSVGGGLAFWTLSRIYYGPRITVPRALRWGLCGALAGSSGTALLVRLWLPECEPQNIAAYDKPSS